jgi:hypothetical protein
VNEHEDLLERLRRMSRQIDDMRATKDETIRMLEDAENQLREKRAGDQIRDTSEEPAADPGSRQK